MTGYVHRTVSVTNFIRRLGPGIITGAADDDPSGIATYSQAGAQTGFGLLWTVVLTWPMMVAVQSISARIGRVTGRGLAANMLDVFPKPAVATGALIPNFVLSGDSLTLVVAVFGTTISPYLFFWQSSQEVEEEEADPKAAPLIDKPQQAPHELERIGWETWVGMGISNLIAFFIMLTTAVTLNAHGQTDIQTSEQAAAALKPIAGNAAFFLFSLGIVGTGLLAVPVLAGSAAYAVGEFFGWRTGLERAPGKEKGFYGVSAAAIVLGVAVDLSPLDPIKALVWSAVVNGVITVPVLVAMMIVVSKSSQMGEFVASRGQRVFGWLTTAMMTAAAVAMFVTM